MPWPRFWLEGESGLAEESIDEIGLLLDAVQLVPHRGGELVCGMGSITGSGLGRLPGRDHHLVIITVVCLTAGLVFEIHQQVAGLLGYPVARGVGGDAGCPANLTVPHLRKTTGQRP
jgi:hypothetical protein